jgi:microcystin-dependent protein
MADDTRTALLDLLKQGTGNNNNTWGSLLNDEVIELLDQAIAGRSSISVTGAGTTLSTAQRRCAILDFSGTLTGNEVVTVANLSKVWIVRNGTSGAFALTMKTSSGDPVTIPQGVWTVVWCNGSNVLRSFVGSTVAFDLLSAASAAAARTIIGAAATEYGVPVGTIQNFGCIDPPSGWLECDGSSVSRSTYAALWAAVSISQSGTRTNGSAIITGLSDTSKMKPGYFVGGTGIPASTTILTVDSGTQITLSANATASGTSTLDIAPWGVGDGSTTFTLPGFTGVGRYLRSRTSSMHLGAQQTDAIASHTHTGTTDSGGAHTHTASTESGGSHEHFIARDEFVVGSGAEPLTADKSLASGAEITDDQDYTLQQRTGSHAAANVGRTSSNGSHTHTVTIASGGAHTHTFTTDATGSTETRPKSAVVLVCIKT